MPSTQKDPIPPSWFDRKTTFSPASIGSVYICEYCFHQVVSRDGLCPECGAALDDRRRVRTNG